jgi:hypothetical protein
MPNIQYIKSSCLHANSVNLFVLWIVYSGFGLYSNHLVKCVLESVVLDKSYAFPPIQWSVLLDPLLQKYPGVYSEALQYCQ